MKIIIAGGRDITDYELVRQAMVESGYWKAFGRSIEVVCGMALSWKWAEDPLIGGVDRLGHRFAKKNGLIVHPFYPDWKTYGKAAGYIRNAEMGAWTKAEGGRLLAVWDGASKGTFNMIEWARKNDLPYYVKRTDK